MTIIRERVCWTLSNSIEWLDMPRRKNQPWQTIELPPGDSTLTPRRTPGVLQINPNEILIFGGEQQGGGGGKSFKARYQFDVNRHTFRKSTKGKNKEAWVGVCPR